MLCHAIPCWACFVTLPPFMKMPFAHCQGWIPTPHASPSTLSCWACPVTLPDLTWTAVPLAQSPPACAICVPAASPHAADNPPSFILHAGPVIVCVTCQTCCPSASGHITCLHRLAGLYLDNFASEYFNSLCVVATLPLDIAVLVLLLECQWCLQAKEIEMALRSGLNSSLAWSLNALTILSFKSQHPLLIENHPGILQGLLQVSNVIVGHMPTKAQPVCCLSCNQVKCISKWCLFSQ